MQPPPRPITTQEIETYQRDGIVCLRQMFDSQCVTSMRDAAEQSMAKPGELHAELADEQGDKGRFFHDTFVWQRNDECRSFVFDSPAAALAGQIMQSSKINIFFDQWLIKEPGTSTKTPWHHDMTYWPIDGFQICTLWLALDEVSAKNGAVEYVKGSHKWGLKYRPASFGGGNQYTENLPSVPDIEAERDKYDIIQFDLQPGDCTFHHGLIVHGAPGNATNELRRRAHTSRWAGDDIRFHPRDGLQEMPDYPPELAPGDPLDSQLWPRIVG